MMKYKAINFETIDGESTHIFIYDDVGNLIKSFPKLDTNESYIYFMLNINEYEEMQDDKRAL